MCPNPCSRFLRTDWPFSLIWIRTDHLIHLGLNEVKSLMLGFALDLSDLIFRPSAACQRPTLLPRVLLQELPDEALGQLARVAEELLVELVVHG